MTDHLVRSTITLPLVRPGREIALRDLSWPALFNWLSHQEHWHRVRTSKSEPRVVWRLNNVHVLFVTGPGPVPTCYLVEVAKLSGVGQRRLIDEARALNAFGGRA